MSPPQAGCANVDHGHSNCGSQTDNFGIIWELTGAQNPSGAELNLMSVDLNA